MKKLVILGPESTGKSTLCENLASHFNTLWCPEYARKYLLTNGTEYSYDDLLIIAKGQVALEEKYIALARSRQDALLFIDTDMHVMKVWCEFVYGKCHPWIEEELLKRQYHGYLLCQPDLPWVKDELREYPDQERRDQLYTLYRNMLEQQRAPWATISGNYTARLATAISFAQRR